MHKKAEDKHKKEEPVSEEPEKTAAGTPGDKQPDVPAPEPSESVTVTGTEWQEVSELAGKAAELQDRFLRLAAEFDNFRKRSDQEKRQLAVFAESSVLTRLLPTLDSLEQILNVAENTEAGSTDGWRLIARELYRTLQDLGLSPADVLGKPFDPHYTEVVEVAENDEVDEGTVLAVLRTGYLYKDKVLRPAMVRISRKKPAAEIKPEAPAETPSRDE